VAVATATPTDRTLGLRPLSAGSIYTERMLFLGEGNAMDAYPFAAWTDMPRDVVGRALDDALRATGRFKDVGDAADLKNPTYILTGELRRFEEVRSSSGSTALCEIHIEVRTYDTRDPVWVGTVTGSETLGGQGPAALAEAMEKAVAKAVADAASQIVLQ
jgi:ABC-type uncharacterized transport system auxiliary subunit